MDPKTGFIILRDDDLANTRRRSLDLLYQPLLHPIGYALVNILWQLSEMRNNPLFKRPIKDLLTYLDVDLAVFKRALRRAEGAGLIKVFSKRESARYLYVFHLIEPLAPRKFFNEDLLSVGLLEMVGDQRFLELSRALIPKPFRIKGVHDLTRNFLEVYNIGGDKHLTNLPQVITRIRSGMAAKMKSTLQDDHKLIDQSPDFNFNLLMKIIKHDSYADPKSVNNHRHLILTEHALYGLDELAMARYIGQAASVTTNQVNFDKFKALIAKDFQGNDRKPVKTKYKSRSASDGNQTKYRALRQNERGLIKAADYYSPVEFLRRLKKTLNPNGVVTYQEESILCNAMDYGAFPDNQGVINILSYYLIAEQKMPTLKSTLVQYMITAWNQAHVNTPADALAQIRAHQQKRAQKWRHYKANQQRRFRYNYHGRSQIKRKLPKWARSDYHVKLHPTSQKLQRKIKQQLKDLNHNRQPNSRKGGHK